MFPSRMPRQVPCPPFSALAGVAVRGALIDDMIPLAAHAAPGGLT